MASNDLQQYQAFVTKNLERISELLARISCGDFSRRIDVEHIEDNEFAEILCGLDLLMDDLVEARRDLEEQSRFNDLRAEIWKCATMGTLSEKDLIQRLLDMVGPHMNVS